MATSSLYKSLWLRTKISTPALRPGSQLCRFMSSWGETATTEPSYTSDDNRNSDKHNGNGHKYTNKKFRIHNNNNNNNNGRSHNQHRHRSEDDPLDRSFTSSNDPNLYRIFFRSPDKIRSLEDAQVFISHVKSSYGPLTQYQFSRCPETKKYFGYGFLTFKQKESLDKALADGYIRVGMKDFELKRTGHTPLRRAVFHKKTGFSGFYDLNELRANKKVELQQKQQQSQQKGQELEQGQLYNSSSSSSEVVRSTEGSSQSQESDSPAENDVRTLEQPESVVSAVLPSSSEPLIAVAAASEAKTNSTKPFYKPLEKKVMAQLWKTIPASIERSERSKPQEEQEGEVKDDGKGSLEAKTTASSQKTSEEVGNMIYKMS
ncbi:hypothetical protein BGZ58_010185 [Dissophora ornata]|nr:hypothetical protein BGZ58_010185 [Dissophora ornata]